MNGYLSWVIPIKFETDDRVPLFSFYILRQEYGFYMLSIIFWIEILMAFGFMGLLSGLASTLVYKLIIQRQGTLLAYAFGFLVVIPFWIIIPYHGLDLFDIQNRFMKFCFGAILPTLGIFRTIAAMYGCAPVYATKSMAAFACHWGFPMTFKFVEKEQKFVKATTDDALKHAKWFLIYVFILGTIQSYSLPSHYQNFGTFGDQPWHDPSRIFDPVQLGNTLVVGVLLQMYLTTASEGLIAAQVLLTGYQCERVMNNPIFTAKSPSDFWGRRWNTLVHEALKRGMYVPLRKHGVPRAWAAAGAFFASGLFHEWLLTFALAPRDTDFGPDGSCELPLCYRPPHGGSTSFMLWNAVIIGMEYAFGHSKAVTMLVRVVPRPIRQAMLVMLALPVGHWFVEPYVVSDFFDQCSLAVPLLKKIT